MKKLIVTAVLGLVAVSALAQGQFQFGNRDPLGTPPIDAPVKNSDGTLLEGAAFLAQAYVKLPSEGVDAYKPVGSAVAFRNAPRAGYITTETVTTAYAKNTLINVQMRAWEASGGNNFEAAMASGKKYGQSEAIQLTVRTAPDVPEAMAGLQGFSLVPEPSTLALGVLGVAALLLRRRS